MVHRYKDRVHVWTAAKRGVRFGQFVGAAPVLPVLHRPVHDQQRGDLFVQRGQDEPVLLARLEVPLVRSGGELPRLPLVRAVGRGEGVLRAVRTDDVSLPEAGEGDGIAGLRRQVVTRRDTWS